MTDSDKISALFEATFSSLKNKSIAIYGTGNNARLILEYVKGFKFVCVISNDFNEELFCGIEVKSLKEALPLIDVIIIAAIPVSTAIIYKRVQDSIPSWIEVYDLRGHNLTSRIPVLNAIKNSVQTYADMRFFELFRKEHEELFDIDSDDTKYTMHCYRDVAWAVAPITIKYLHFIFSIAKDYDYLLFASRDGYLLNKLYNVYTSEHAGKWAKGIYFYTSRTSISSACIKNKEDINVLRNKIDEDESLNISDFIQNQFHLSTDEEYDITVREGKKIWGEQGFEKKIEDLLPKILSNSEKLRKNYNTYIDTLNLSGKIAVIDIVTQGTIVYGLSRLIGQDVDLIAMGTTAIPNKYIRDERRVHSMLGSVNEKIGDIPYSFSDFSELHLFLEMLYASDEGQVYEFSETGKPIFTNGSEYNRILVPSVQEEILSIVQDFGMDNDGGELSSCFCTTMLSLFYNKYSDYDNKIMDEFSFDDPYDSNMQKCNLIEKMGW